MIDDSGNLPAVQTQPESIFLDKAMVIRGKKGDIRRIKTNVSLSVQDKTLVQIIKPYGNNDGIWTPTATGYRLLGSRCGLAYEKPDTVIVNGVAQANPCWTEDNKTCYSRTRVGGYTELGQPVISDRTVEFSVHRYNVQDLIAKAMYAGKETPLFKILPYRGKDEDGVMKGAPELGDWGGYRLDEAMVLWIRTDSNPDIFKWYKEMNNRLKHALKTVQTFSERNAVMAHPALPSKRQWNSEQARLTCAQWFTKEGNITFRLLSEENEIEIIQGEDVMGDDKDDDKEKAEEQKVIEAEAVESAETADDVPESEKEDNLDMGEKKDERQESKDIRKEMIWYINSAMLDKDKEADVKAGFKRAGLSRDLKISTLDTETLESLYETLKTVIDNAG